jgi:hypothetical protein
MNHHVRRRNDTFIRMTAYRQQFPADFPAAAVEAEQMDVIEEVVAEIGEAGSDQIGNYGEARFEYANKGVARENLRECVEEIGGIAPSMAYEFPGIDVLFHVKRNLTDTEMLALGKVFHEKSEGYEAGFIKYHLDTNFRSNLNTAVSAFETSLVPPEMALESQVEATAKLENSVRRGMIAWRILRGVMRQKYKNNPAKYQSWLTASRIEKDSTKDDKGENEGGGDGEPTS